MLWAIHVGAGNQTHVLPKCRTHSQPLSHLSSPTTHLLKTRLIYLLWVYVDARSLISFYHVGPRDKTQAVRLGSTLTYGDMSQAPRHIFIDKDQEPGQLAIVASESQALSFQRPCDQIQQRKAGVSSLKGQYWGMGRW